MFQNMWFRPKHLGFNDYLLILTLCIAVFYVNFNTTAVANSLSAIQTELGLSNAGSQWVINIYLLTAASLIIIGGQLGDMFGRRVLFLIGILSFWLAAILISFAGTAELVFVGRCLQGIGAALVTPGALAIIKVHIDETHHHSAIGILTAAMGLGYAAGPSLGGFLTLSYGWQSVFWLMLPLLTLVVILTLWKVKPVRRFTLNQRQQKLDLLGLLLFVFGMVPFVFGLVEANVWGWTRALTLSFLIGGALILVLFWYVEERVRSPLIDFSHFEKKLFALSIAGLGNTVFSLLTILYFFNLYMQNSLLLNFTPFESGIAMLPMSISMFIISLYCSRLVQRWGLRNIALISSCSMAIGFALLSFVNIKTTYMSLWLPLLLCGTGFGLGMSAFLSLGMSSLPGEKAGEASGILSTINFLASIFSISLGNILFSHAGQHAVYKIIKSASITPVQQSYLTSALNSQQHLLAKLLENVDPSNQKLIITTLQYSALSSLHSVIVCNLTIIIGVILLTHFLIKE